MTEEQELQIQRLVDGQLDRQQIKHLLNEAQTSQVLWRELAVAFVENQIFSSESRRFANGKAALPIKQTDRSQSEIRPGWLPSLGLSRFHLSTAAMLLLAIGMGFLLGQNRLGVRGLDSANSNSRFGSEDRSLVNSPYMIEFLDDTGQPIPGQSFPILSENDAQARGYKPAPLQVPNKLQSQFHKAGWELAPGTQWVEFQLSDGQRFVLPIRNVKLQSYGQ